MLGGEQKGEQQIGQEQRCSKGRGPTSPGAEGKGLREALPGRRRAQPRAAGCGARRRGKRAGACPRPCAGEGGLPRRPPNVVVTALGRRGAGEGAGLGLRQPAGAVPPTLDSSGLQETAEGLTLALLKRENPGNCKAARNKGINTPPVCKHLE